MINYEARLTALRQAMAGWGADLLFLNPGADFYYLTGIATPPYYDSLRLPGDCVSGLLVSHDREPILILHESLLSDSMPTTWVKDLRVMKVSTDLQTQDPANFLAPILADLAPPGKTIAVAKTVWSETLLALQQAAPGARFVAATAAMLDQVRAVKDEDELHLMRKAAEITDAALAATYAQLRPGMSEWDVASEVDYQMRRAGGDGPAFSTGVIAVAPGSDLKRRVLDRNHRAPIGPGTSIAFDFGARYQGYCCDFGRTFFVGEPGPQVAAAYAALARASQGLMAVLGDGKLTAEEAAGFVAGSIAADGFGQYHYHPGLGHGIGLEVHEGLWLFPGVKVPVRKGMCFTFEPKIWLPGQAYMRVEDVVVVGVGRAEPLTRFSYEPMIVG